MISATAPARTQTSETTTPAVQTLALVGHPNSGKTALFNALTGQHAPVGNWGGVTVTVGRGRCQWTDTAAICLDLPGIYSLVDEVTSEDEQVTLDTLHTTPIDLVIQVVRADQLERQLFLTSELLEIGIPVVVVLTMRHVLHKQALTIDSEALAARLQVPVCWADPRDIASMAVVKRTLRQGLKEACASTTPLALSLPGFPAVQQTQSSLRAEQKPAFQAHYLAWRHYFDTTATRDADLHIADARYAAVHEICLAVQRREGASQEQFTRALDRVFLHRWLGLPVFFGLMYAIFFVAIKVGGGLQNGMEQFAQAWLVDASTAWLRQQQAADWIIQVLSNGVGRGLTTTLTFIPVLGLLFLFLSILEQSGYMARAAFVMDRCMRWLGLPGKAFVPLLIGFGCNVPAILATRVLNQRRDRLLTALMVPFMSCSARLAIYTIFVSAFFHDQGQNVIFSLYLLGLFVAVFTGWVLRKLFVLGTLSPLLLELPVYQTLQWRGILGMTGRKLSGFLKRAALLIVPTCVGLSVLNVMHTAGGVSLLSAAGQSLTPLFAPMGLDPHNWPAVVGLFTGVLAKEVVIGSMSALYQPTGAVSMSAILPHYFHSTASVYAYLSFILLYLPCISTMAAIKQEISSFFMWLSVGWSFFIAYTVAVLVYQLSMLLGGG